MPWHGKAFHITGPLWGESISDQWILFPYQMEIIQSFDVLFVFAWASSELFTLSLFTVVDNNLHSVLYI